MMFVGAIPRETAEQTFRLLDPTTVTDAYVCCSGSYRFEQALSKQCPDIRIHSNDVSLLSTVIGSAAAGDPVDFTFTGELEFLEEALVGLDGGDAMDRVAAMTVALKMCHFRGNNPHVDAHREHYRANAAHYIAKAKERVVPYIAELNTVDFFAGDFREHAERSTGPGDAVFAWPPLFKGDYERFYKLIHENVDWTVPSYDMWNPKLMPAWLTKLDEAEQRYVVCSDTDFSDQSQEPVGLFTAGRTKRIYLYSSEKSKSTIRHRAGKSEVFKYRRIDPWTLTEDSVVELFEVKSGPMNYIKDKYQLPGLVHSDGEMRFLVFVGGALAGGFVYSTMSSKAGYSDPRINRRDTVYILSDFSTSRERKLSKLTAMLAACALPLTRFGRKKLLRPKNVITTAFSRHPVSMKYRGIYELYSRAEDPKGFRLNYFSEVRDGSPQDVYTGWWNRYAKKAKRKATPA